MVNKGNKNNNQGWEWFHTLESMSNSILYTWDKEKKGRRRRKKGGRKEWRKEEEGIPVNVIHHINRLK